MTLDFEDKLLEAINKEYLSVTEIAKALDAPRNRVQVHIFKLRKWKQVVRVMNKNNDQGVIGWKYRASYEERRRLIKLNL